MNIAEQELKEDILAVGLRLGIPVASIEAAYEHAADKRALHRRWRGLYVSATRRVEENAARLEAAENAETARERHTERQRLGAERLRREREMMTLGNRLDLLSREFALVETSAAVTRSGAEASLGRGAPDSGAPPDYKPIRVGELTLDEHWLWFKARIEELEIALDEHRGLAVGRNWQMASKEEKDREILGRYRGVHSKLVSQIAPYLGSKRVIENVRAEAGLRPSTGEPK